MGLIIYLKSKYWQFRALLKRHSVIVTPGDYLYLRNGTVDFSQFIICCRILDIEQYKKDRIPTFHYSNALSGALIQNFNSEDNDARFAALLESVEKYGFQTKKRIGFNEEFTVNDGTHRSAIAYVEGLNQINAYYYSLPSNWSKIYIDKLYNDKKFKNKLGTIHEKILTIGEDLKRKGFLCTAILFDYTEQILLNIEDQLSKNTEIVIKKEIDLSGTEDNFNFRFPSSDKKYVDYQNACFIGFIPKFFDYVIRGNRMSFRSIGTLSEQIKCIHPYTIITDNFVDGVNVYNNLKPFFVEK